VSIGGPFLLRQSESDNGGGRQRLGLCSPALLGQQMAEGTMAPGSAAAIVGDIGVVNVHLLSYPKGGSEFGFCL
jgi:hypothetical protein